MVNRILKFDDTVPANEVAHVLDAYQPRQGQTYTVEEIWTDGTAGVEISLTVRERTLIDSVPADDLPGAGDGLVFDLRIQSGEELAVLGSETSGADQSVAVYVLIDES